MKCIQSRWMSRAALRFGSFTHRKACLRQSCTRRSYAATSAMGIPLPVLLRQAGLEEAAAGCPDVEITNIVTINSEEMGEGSLFVCVRSNINDDGHDFVWEAAEFNISAVIADREVPEPPPGLPIVMVPDCEEALAKLEAALAATQ